MGEELIINTVLHLFLLRLRFHRFLLLRFYFIINILVVFAALSEVYSKSSLFSNKTTISRRSSSTPPREVNARDEIKKEGGRATMEMLLSQNPHKAEKWEEKETGYSQSDDKEWRR